MNLIFDYDLAIEILNLIIRVISIVIILFFIFPLQIKQSKVKNGLRKLRARLLHTGMAILGLNFFSAIIVMGRLILNDDLMAFLLPFISFVTGLLFLYLAWLGYRIYQEQYLEE